MSTQNNKFSNFESIRPIFVGMGKHYKDNVLPKIIELDDERNRTLNEALLAQGFIGVLCFVVLILLANTIGIIGLIIWFVISIIIMVLIWNIQTEWVVLNAKKALISGVMDFFGWSYLPSSEEPEAFKKLCDLKLLDGFDSKSFNDQISGTAFNREFTLTEIFLTRTDTRTETSTDHNGHSTSTTKSETVTVFNGCLIEIDTPQKFLGETIVLRRGLFFNPKKIGGLKKVGLASIKFEKVLNAYGSDQVESRHLLTPTFIEQISAFERAYKGKNLRFAFLDGNLNILLETGDRFKFGGITQSLLDASRIDNLLKEIEATFDLIEGLLPKKPQDWIEDFGHDPFLTKHEINDL